MDRHDSAAPAARRDDFVVVPHHPDRLRRPPARAASAARERARQALTWNIFRTLELLPPAFWLRRLHARLFATTLAEAPQIVRVGLWRPLPLPPAQRLDGLRPDVLVDVSIETEQAAWSLMCWDADDEGVLDGGPAGDAVAQAIDAGTWHAGSRRHHFGIIGADSGPASPGQVIARRYARSRHSASLRSGSRGAPAAVAEIGVTTWAALAAVLRECGDAEVLTPVERSVARDAVAWFEHAGLA